MTLRNLYSICQAFDKMGFAIQGQLETVINGEMNGENINTNALTYIKEFLGKVQRYAEDDEELTEQVGSAIETIENYEANPSEQSDVAEILEIVRPAYKKFIDSGKQPEDFLEWLDKQYDLDSDETKFIREELGI